MELNEQERGSERYRRAILSALAKALSTGTSVIISYASVPLCLNYLGREQYGVLVTISSLNVFTAFADFGLGAGLVGAIADDEARKKGREAPVIVSTAFWSLMIVAGVLGFAVIGLGHFLAVMDWGGAVNANSEISTSVVAYLGLLLFGVPFGVVQHFQSGRQEGYKTSLWQAVGRILSLASLVLAINAHSSLTILVIASSAGPLVGTLLNFGAEWHGNPQFRPLFRRLNPSVARELWSSGWVYFGIQVTTAIAIYSDNLLVANLLSLSDVTQYSISLRLFALPAMITMMALYPLWPAYTDAIAKNDHRWVRSTVITSWAMTLTVSIVVGAGTLILSKELLTLWVGSRVSAEFQLLLPLALSAIITTSTNPLNVYMYGAKAPRFCLTCSAALVPVALAAKILLGRRFGNPGIAWGGALSYAVCISAPALIYVWMRLATSPRQSEQYSGRLSPVESELEASPPGS